MTPPLAERASARWGRGLRKGLLLLALGVGILLLGCSGPSLALGGEGEGSGPAPYVGRPAPDFGLLTLEGKMLRLSDLRGKAVLINFWATWCPPCRAEMPELQAAYDEYRDRGFVVLGVNLQEDKGTITEFMDRMGLTFPVVMDTTGNVGNAYRVRDLPTSFFVDREGVIRDRNIGAMNKSTIVAKLQKIL